MAPIPKPGKDPGNPKNRRPISLICTGMKILEQIIYNRIIHQIELELFSGQYAYRRSLSTEHHLTMMMDYTHRALLEGRFVYLVSYDIASAFDRVPHAQLMRALEGCGIEPYTKRLIHNWLRGRSFEVKYNTLHRRGHSHFHRSATRRGAVSNPLADVF